jgi:ABC-type phosphate/phosphonate transport system substrate-binding protein
LAAGLVLLLVTGSASAQPLTEVRIEIVQGLFQDISPAMIKVLGAPLRELLRREAGVTGDVGYSADSQTLAERMKDKKCELGVFHGFEFAWAQRQNPDLVPLVVTVYPTGRPQACVVVRADSPAKALADLKDAAVTVPTGTRGHCLLYLTKQRDGLPEATAAPKQKPPVSTEDALEAVATGESPAALVDVAALAGYQNLHPGAAKRLRVLCKSDAFPQNVIAYTKGSLSDETAKKLRKALTEAHETPAGKPLMILWSIKRFGEIPAEYEKHLEAAVKAYPPPAAPGIRATGGQGR